MKSDGAYLFKHDDFVLFCFSLEVRGAWNGRERIGELGMAKFRVSGTTGP